MSGPKVVRIVTREEILAICAGHLRRLETAIARWVQHATRIGELNASEQAATYARRDQLQRLIDADQLRELQTRVPIEIEFLQRDLAQREARAVQRATEQRQWQRRLRENAATLLKALHDKDAPAALLEQLQALADGQGSEQAERILAQGFAALSTAPAESRLSEAQQQLARRLQTDSAPLTLAQWRAAHEQHEPRLLDIDRHIAHLQTLDSHASAEPYLAKLTLIEEEHRPQQRNLLLDSLVLELAAATRACNERRARWAQLQDLAAEVETLLGETAEALLKQVQQCTAEDLETVSALSEQYTALIAEHLQQQAALARRQAVLEGLSSLGYEVREGMATAWAEKGRVVLRKTATPGYGVEVGGSADNGRLQVRAVALTANHDTQRDKDIETIWCSEFQRLQALLAAQGDDLSIEKALAVGAVPLKEVALDAALEQQDVRQLRTL